MNLEDIIDPEYGLQQDEWSLTKPRFGKENQLEVIGWSGRASTNNGKKGVRYFITHCSVCSRDSHLFGEGYFKMRKGDLINGYIPCGCAKKPIWSPSQY